MDLKSIFNRRKKIVFLYEVVIIEMCVGDWMLYCKVAVIYTKYDLTEVT